MPVSKFVFIFVGIAIITILLALLLTIHASIKLIVNAIRMKSTMQRDIEIYKIKYSEEEILKHLDFIITECFEYYIAMNITPKEIYYINSKMETEMLNKLAVIVSERISPTLYTQLSLIYDSSQLSTVIGEKIYARVLEYVLPFNVENEKMNKK